MLLAAEHAVPELRRFVALVEIFERIDARLQRMPAGRIGVAEERLFLRSESDRVYIYNDRTFVLRE